ncbi:MAG: DEAD/DEAH box helicase family protein [Acidobacteria bacterium]|nr:DEAD/DEAH box helicase family protein [Acidobacteriota bacterium]
MAVDVSPNFAFLAQEFFHVAESATMAERSIYGDPRASCFHARHTLEQLVKRIFKLDERLTPPRVTNLDGYLNEPPFREIVGETIWQKAEYVRKAGNDAVHGNKTPEPAAALDVMRELYHLLYWAGRTYLRKGAEKLEGVTYDESIIPPALAGAPVSIEKLEAITKERDAAEEKRRELETQVEELRQRVAAIRAENEKVPDRHDYDEAATRKRIIDLELARAGWALDQPRDREYEVTGMPKRSGEPAEAGGRGYADYVLWGDDGRPLAVVEAKRTIVDSRRGQEQARLYANCLETMHGQRPLIYFTNGYKTWLWDDLMYPPREVAGFCKKDELETLIRRREQRKPLDVAQVKDEIAGRYYQKRAIGSIAQHFASGHRRALLVMATGTGKTRTAVALVDLLQRAGWVKRALFLADRKALVRQAVNAFKAHLPESSPVNLVTEKDKSGRVYVCTYPTMMGLIDETRPGAAGSETRFGVGHFDLVIIDEAHRSVYQKYGAIFRYFDSLLVGLTATPRDQVDRNTYTLFGLEPGMPTDAYELETAVADGFLVPPRVEQVNLRFPREGISYDDLTEEEQDEWESTDWGDDGETPAMPDRVEPQAINNWLFNADTVDKALQHLMEHGHKVDGGDRLAKTIIFARRHEHALFIEQRFNHHYPHHAGKFARVIDNYETYALSLIDDFSRKEKDPHIAISVDMLDTGIDIPEVANLVFFKPVYSKIKFWQMIGRGTRLAPDLFGPGMDKEDFRIFDFCYNFDFFRVNPDGIERTGGMPLGARLFRSRVQLLGHLQRVLDLDADDRVRTRVADALHAEVAAMNPDNFVVRMHLEPVQRFQERAAWNALSEEDRQALEERIAGLPSEIETDAIESRLFDMMAVRMQLALIENDVSTFETARNRAVALAMLLEEKSSIPAVRDQLGYLASMQETEFWTGIGVADLEEMRLRLRGLVPLLDRKQRHIVYTDFEDQITDVVYDGAVGIPRMTGAQYQKKVEQFLLNNLNDIVIHRLRTNQPLSESDLEELERMLVEIGEEDGEQLLSGLLARTETPSLVYFVRRLVGMDRSAAQAAFADLLSDRSLTPPQIRFVEMIIEQLTARGVMEPGALYEAPFTSLHAGGPDELFAGKEEVIRGMFDAIIATQPPRAAGEVG